MMATEPLLSPGVVVLTDSRPPAKSILILPATLTSFRLALLIGFDQHHGVGPVARGDPYLGTGDFQGGGDGAWRGEGRHGGFLRCLVPDLLADVGPEGQARLLKVASDHR